MNRYHRTASFTADSVAPQQTGAFRGVFASRAVLALLAYALTVTTACTNDQTATMTSIAITAAPTTTSYPWGTAALDTTGLVVTALYDDGAEQTLTAAQYALSGFDGSTLGAQTVTVTENVSGAALSATFTVTVTPATLGIDSALTVEAAALTTGNTVNHYDGVWLIACPKLADASTLASVDLSSYAGKKVSATLTATVRPLSALGTDTALNWNIDNQYADANGNPAAPSVAATTAKSGEWVTLTGTMTVDLESGRRLCLSGAGLKTDSLNVYVAGFSWSVTVISDSTTPSPTAADDLAASGASLTAIAITTAPADTSYVVGESFSPNGLTVTATYDTGATLALTAAQYALSGFSSATPGTITVTVTENVSGKGRTATFPVTVVAATTTDDTDNSDDTNDAKTPATTITAFTLTSACGWGGTASVTATATTVGSTSGYLVTNKNWNSAPTFTVDLGTAKLGDYAGFTCKIKASGCSMAYKTLYLEIKGLSATTFAATGQTSSTNIRLGSATTGGTATDGTEVTLSFPFDFASLDAAVAALTGKLEMAVGLSANSGSAYYLYNMALVAPDADAVYIADAPSLKDAYANIFDYFGIAVEAAEFRRADVQAALKRHCDSITMGNEFKPDYILGTAPTSTASFTAADGLAYDVPASLNFATVDEMLGLCKANALTMRGHVLVWHSQSPAWFFRSGFSASGAYVNKATMNARLEWYVKSVIQHVQAWETANNSGAHIVTTWDVVNEAVSDSATTAAPLRGSHGEASDWYSVYGNADFIVNAFVYANAYAASDVLLAYNDYNCYVTAKTAGICAVIDAIKAANGARLDAIGMQSHVGMTYPGVTAHETAVKKFIAKGLDVQITELDINCTDNTASGQSALATLYGDYFTMFRANRKTASAHGITGVTIWGLSDANTWLTGQNNGTTAYPLLFDGYLYAKPAFDAVIAAAK